MNTSFSLQTTLYPNPPMCGAGAVLIMGSAPNFQLPKGHDVSWGLVTVNASQVLAESFGLSTPDMALMRRGIIVGKDDQDFYKRALLQGSRARHLVVPVWQGAKQELAVGCRSFGYGYDSLLTFTKWQLATIVWRLSGKYPLSRGWHRKISTGAFAILLARFSGFDPVVVSGFSFSQSGHGYDDRKAFRFHVDEDAILLRRLVVNRQPIYAADLDFARESGLPLWDCDAANTTR